MPVAANPPSLPEAIQRLPLASFGARFWRVDLTGEPDAAAIASLSADEHARAARYIFEEHRRRFQIAHGALRALLAMETGLPAGSLEFVTNPHGKPALAGRPECFFNMSHSDSAALVVIAHDLPAGSELGVDLEELRTMRDVTALAAMNFTRAEQAELEAAPPGVRDRVFLSGWTRKEACLKALGSGLSIAPATFDCGLAACDARVFIPVSAFRAEIDVQSIEVDAAHMAAVALMHPAPALQDSIQ
jgi:4'-phosphopantetheinyl transferase